MKRIRIRVTPWRDQTCSRTIEFTESHTLYDVHQAIQRAFELDDDHLWAFYLSGRYGDRSTAFGSE